MNRVALTSIIVLVLYLICVNRGNDEDYQK